MSTPPGVTQTTNHTVYPFEAAPLDLILGVVLYWLLIGVAGLARSGGLRFVSRSCFPWALPVAWCW